MTIRRRSAVAEITDSSVVVVILSPEN